MRHYTLYMWVGVWLIVLPLLGIPGSWKDALLVLSAIFIIAYASVEYRRTRLGQTPSPERGAAPERDSSKEKSTEDTL